MAEKWGCLCIAQGVTHIQDNTPESILTTSCHTWPQPLGHGISFLLMPFLLPQFWTSIHSSNSAQKGEEIVMRRLHNFFF